MARLATGARWILRWALRACLAAAALLLVLIFLFRFVDPPATPYMLAEARRAGGVDRAWVPLEAIAPHMRRAAVAAEDANFCLHHGFDVAALRAALEGGARRGGSTITQQTVKNVFLWQGRSWPRKALEALITPVVEVAWPKARILEIYLNVAETGPATFGVEAAARDRFGVAAADLGLERAARIAVALPNPKARDPADLSNAQLRRMRRVMDGAETIRGGARAACFGG